MFPQPLWEALQGPLQSEGTSIQGLPVWLLLDQGGAKWLAVNGQCLPKIEDTKTSVGTSGKFSQLDMK